jgi:hypothetical protein
MLSPKTIAIAGTATLLLAAAATHSLAQFEYYTGMDIPNSTCGQANCANCRQGKLNTCPLCMDQNNPNYIDAQHPAVCFSIKNNLNTAIGAWCMTAGSGTQGCRPLTLNNNNPQQCGSVLVWHCFPCLTAAASCMGNVCPCTPGEHDQTNSPINVGAQQYTCTDFTIPPP